MSFFFFFFFFFFGQEGSAVLVLGSTLYSEQPLRVPQSGEDFHRLGGFAVSRFQAGREGGGMERWRINSFGSPYGLY